jgi:hypothetical protein
MINPSRWAHAHSHQASPTPPAPSCWKPGRCWIKPMTCTGQFDACADPPSAATPARKKASAPPRATSPRLSIAPSVSSGRNGGWTRNEAYSFLSLRASKVSKQSSSKHDDNYERKSAILLQEDCSPKISGDRFVGHTMPSSQ